jgi:uncharacterized membrane protein
LPVNRLLQGKPSTGGMVARGPGDTLKRHRHGWRIRVGGPAVSRGGPKVPAPYPGERDRSLPDGGMARSELPCFMPAVKPRPPSRIAVPGNAGVKVVKSCTIRAPAGELYRFWRNFSNLPRIIRHPVRVTVLNETESEWSVSAPLSSKQVTWRATIINERAPELIAWRSSADAEVPNAGSVRFEPAPGDEGTEVKVAFEFDPPGGKWGGAIAKLSPEAPSRQVADTLRRLKALFEAGEIPTIDGQSVGEPQRSKRK